MQALSIVILSVLAALAYGIVHDQVTARVCIEYFTIGHPQILSVPTQSPTVLGFVWGVVATWWVGVALGVPLAIAARFGRRPQIDAKRLIRPIFVLLSVTAVCALVAGVVGFLLVHSGTMSLEGALGAKVLPQRHAGFVADAFAHITSYIVGAVGGIVLIVATWRSRKSLPMVTSAPTHL